MKLNFTLFASFSFLVLVCCRPSSCIFQIFKSTSQPPHTNRMKVQIEKKKIWSKNSKPKAQQSKRMSSSSPRSPLLFTADAPSHATAFECGEAFRVTHALHALPTNCLVFHATTVDRPRHRILVVPGCVCCVCCHDLSTKSTKTKQQTNSFKKAIQAFVNFIMIFVVHCTSSVANKTRFYALATSGEPVLQTTLLFSLFLNSKTKQSLWTIN